MRSREQIYFFFDQNRCTGCAACGVACKDWNGVPAGREVQWRRVYSTEAGTFPRVDVTHLCMSCLHCAEPACAKACPTGAIYKEEEHGFVIVNRDVCNGCRQCQVACPYGAPQYAPGEPKMMKCTFCHDRQAVGKKPACVDACPYEALDSGTEAALRARHGPDIAPLRAGTLEGIGAEHEATVPSLFVRARPLRIDPGAPRLTRKNGYAVGHTRPIAGPEETSWRERASTPYQRKPRKLGC